MELRDLIRLCYNAGGYRYTDGKPVASRGFDWWWAKYGQERHDDFVLALSEGVKLRMSAGYFAGRVIAITGVVHNDGT